MARSLPSASSVDDLRDCFRATTGARGRPFFFAGGVRYADSPMQAVKGADALVVMTEWKAFKSPSFTALKVALRQPVIFDGRNLYEPAIRSQGFEYFAIGR